MSLESTLAFSQALQTLHGFLHDYRVSKRLPDGKPLLKALELLQEQCTSTSIFLVQHCRYTPESAHELVNAAVVFGRLLNQPGWAYLPSNMDYQMEMVLRQLLTAM